MRCCHLHAQAVIDFFNSRLDSVNGGQAAAPEGQADWSVGRVLELVQTFAQVGAGGTAAQCRAADYLRAVHALPSFLKLRGLCPWLVRRVKPSPTAETEVAQHISMLQNCIAACIAALHPQHLL